MWLWSAFKNNTECNWIAGLLRFEEEKQPDNLPSRLPPCCYAFLVLARSEICSWRREYSIISCWKRLFPYVFYSKCMFPLFFGHYRLPCSKLKQFHTYHHVHLLPAGSVWAVHAEISMVEKIHDKATVGKGTRLRPHANITPNSTHKFKLKTTNWTKVDRAK